MAAGGDGAEVHLLERAWVVAEPGGAPAVRDRVLVRVRAGRFVEVRPDARPGQVPEGAHIVPGLTLPGLANTHSHAFHRALRGRTQRDGGTFWTWREQMYRLAARLDPPAYARLARAVFGEMVAAGVTAVGEFHYLHHRPDGTPHGPDEGGPNAMADALIGAARDAGLRIALLDVCYLAGGFGRAVSGAQVRYDDGSVAAWRRRTTALRERHDGADGVVIGAAAHSVRAVPPEALARVADAAGERPLHVHVSEQVAENDDCRAATGRSPVRLLADAGFLGERTTLVHATHLDADDVALIGRAGCSVSFCPTTERDLGDGIGPSRELAAAGARLTLGSDSHAVIDLFEEMRAVELDERLRTRARGHWRAHELLEAASVAGHRSLGFDDAGAIVAGARADLVTVASDAPSTAGTGADEQTAVFAATAADVTRVVIDGRVVHTAADRGEVGRLLAEAVAELEERA